MKKTIMAISPEIRGARMSRFTIASSVLAVAAMALLSTSDAFSEQWLGDTGKLYVDPTSTKVGIGTDDPQAPLTVAAPGEANALFQTDDTGYTNSDGLYVGVYGGDAWIWNYEDSKMHIGGSGNGIIIDPAGTSLELNAPHGETALSFKAAGIFNWGIERDMNALVFRDDHYGEDVLTLKGGSGYSFGFVGIGTRTPQSELAVNGTITAKEVIVTTSGWPDYVFDEEYSLASLENVESFIEENKHLPDIPSAKEVEENGLAMSDMLTKQMRKIEELTLYLIEMKGENEQMKSRITALEQGQ